MAKLAPPPPVTQDVNSKQYKDWLYSIYALVNGNQGLLGSMAYQNANSVAITGGTIGNGILTSATISASNISNVGITTATISNATISNSTVTTSTFTLLLSEPVLNEIVVVDENGLGYTPNEFKSALAGSGLGDVG